MSQQKSDQNIAAHVIAQVVAHSICPICMSGQKWLLQVSAALKRTCIPAAVLWQAWTGCMSCLSLIELAMLNMASHLLAQLQS